MEIKLFIRFSDPFCVEINVYVQVIWKKYSDTGWCKCEKKTGVVEICVKCFSISFAQQLHFSFITSEKSVKCLVVSLSELNLLVWVGVLMMVYW
jgi:hypothetical protein